MALLTLLFPSHLLLPLLFSYLPSTVLSSTSLISPSISSLFTAYSVCGLPTLTALQSFIKQLINSTRTHLHTDAHTHVHMHAGMCEIFIGGGLYTACVSGQGAYGHTRAGIWCTQRKYMCVVAKDMSAWACLDACLVRASVHVCICYQQCPSVLAEGQSI